MPTVVTLQGWDSPGVPSAWYSPTLSQQGVMAPPAWRGWRPAYGYPTPAWCPYRQLGAPPDPSTAGERPVGPVAIAVLSFFTLGAVVAGAVYVTRRRPARGERELGRESVRGRPRQHRGLADWEENPLWGDWQYSLVVDGVRFQTARIIPQFYRDARWRRRWENELREEIAKFRRGKPTRLFKVSDYHYTLPGQL